MNNNTSAPEVPPSLRNVFQLIQAHRPAFCQARPYWRIVGLVFGELFNSGRYTLTQSLLALGVTDGDWSAWYRLLSRRRFGENVLANSLIREMLPLAPAI